MLEMCVQQEKDEKGNKRYVLSLENDLGESLFIMKKLKQAIVKMGDRFWSEYWEVGRLYSMISQYLPKSELSQYSIEELEKALRFGVVLDLCVTQIRQYGSSKPTSVYRIL